MMFKNLSPSALGVSGHQSEIIELALTYGFAGMDLNIVEHASAVRLRGAEYARRLIESAKIRIGFFPLPVELDADDAEFKTQREKLADYAALAAELGCTRTIATIPSASDTRPYHEGFEVYRQRLADVGAALAPSGVRLGLGFQSSESLRKGRAFQFIHDLEALSLLVNMVASPSVGLLIDTWELAAVRCTAETIGKLSPAQIVAVQVADYPAQLSEQGEPTRLLPGDESGTGQTAPILAALQSLGYNGPVTPKVSRSNFSTRKRDMVVKQAGEALDRVWRAAGIPIESRRQVPSGRE